MPRAARWVLPILAVSALLRCSGKPFITSGDTGGRGGGPSGQGGDTDAGGNAGGEAGGTESGGDTGTGGTTTGGASSAGTAGTGDCVCKAGEYCRADMCHACSDYSALDYAAPEPIGVQGTSGPLRFPRVISSQGALFYVGGNPPGIWFSNSLTGTGRRVSPMSGPPEMSPLLLSTNAIFGQNFLFDRMGPEGLSVQLGNFDGSNYSQLAAAPAPINIPDSNNSGIAVAVDTQRMWWTSDRFGVPRLVTALAGASDGEVEELAIRIPAAGGAECDALEGEATAWVTRDGRLLLFSHPALDENCSVVDGGTPDVYALLLGSDGQALAPRAVSIAGVSGPGIDTDPSLSPDGCDLFFASDRGQPGMTTLFRATRR